MKSYRMNPALDWLYEKVTTMFLMFVCVFKESFPGLGDGERRERGKVEDKYIIGLADRGSFSSFPLSLFDPRKTGSVLEQAKMNYDPCQFLDDFMFPASLGHIHHEEQVYMVDSPHQQQQRPQQQQQPLLSPPSLSSSASSSQELPQLHNHPRPDYSAITTRTAPITSSEMIPAMTSVDRNWTPLHENDFYSTREANAAVYCPSPPSLLTHGSIVQECSDTFILLTGYSPLELIGKSFADFLHPDDLYHHRQQQQTQHYQLYYHHSHQAPTTSAIALYRFYKKDGTTIPLEYRQGPNHRGECKYVGFTGDCTTSNSVPGSDIHRAGLKADFENSSFCMNSSVISHASIISPVSKPIHFYVSK